MQTPNPDTKHTIKTSRSKSNQSTNTKPRATITSVNSENLPSIAPTAPLLAGVDGYADDDAVLVDEFDEEEEAVALPLANAAALNAARLLGPVSMLLIAMTIPSAEQWPVCSQKTQMGVVSLTRRFQVGKVVAVVATGMLMRRGKGEGQRPPGRL